MNQKKTISLILLAVLAILSYFLTDSDEQKTSTNNKQSTNITAPDFSSASLGNYDVHMKNDRLKQNIVETDYYTLALSWSPAFCQRQKRNNNGKIPSHLKYQCDGTQQFGWVIHGLWPQSSKAKRIEEHPRYCQGDLPMVAENTIKAYMSESPGATLLQGQWEKHGACAFNQASEYFEKQKALYNTLNLPDFHSPKSDLFNWMRANNPQLNGVYLGSSKEELYICYNKNWQPMDCPR